MPSKKVTAVLIVCLSGIFSIWMISKIPTTKQIVENRKDEITNNIEVSPYNTIAQNTNDDWKKMLSVVTPTTQSVIQTASANNSEFTGTTITDQIAADFLSQYLVLKTEKDTLTKEDLNKIAQNTASNPQYIQNKGPVYYRLNIKVVPNTPLNLAQYKKEANLSMRTRSLQIKDDPAIIFENFLRTQDSTVLKKFDYLIQVGQGSIADFLGINVPESAVVYHLSLLNSYSNLVSSMQAMGNVDSDPVKAFFFVSEYNKSRENFLFSLKTMNNFLSSIKIP